MPIAKSETLDQPPEAVEATLQALAAGHPANAFAVLGQHQDDSGSLWIRALLPRATTVEVLDSKSQKRVATLAHTPGDIFAAKIPRRKNRFPYHLKITWPDGQTTVTQDPYQFSSSLAEADLSAFHQGQHPRPYTFLGAHPITHENTPGIRFTLWAPNATRVAVVGDWNAWDSRRHPMRHHPQYGIWELFIPGLEPGHRYKYALLDGSHRRLPLKADPYAFAAELRPANASVISALPAVRPLPAGRQEANQRSAPISIYEVHLGSWQRHPDGRWLSWDELAERLPAYAADLGFTHVELLPVSEHPFDGSWGYQTLGLYAATARFGPPEGLQRLIDACHARGLGVLLDWVPAHFPTDDWGLAQFDGTALYEYADPREGFHRDWNTLIYNTGRHEVKSFLAGSALYWLERYGVDGLRVDAVASMLYRDYSRPSGEWVPNAHGGRENLEAIAFLKRMNEVVGAEAPGAITVAEESTAFPGVSRPTSAGGLGFHYKWNLGWMHDTLDFMRRDPIHRQWHYDRMTFGLVYAFDENFVLPLSHDEVVHGKGALLGKMPGDRWQQFANLRAYYAFMWTHPGKKLLFMGGELAQDTEWNHDTALPWHLLDQPDHGGIQSLIRDLNTLYRSRPALHQRDCEPAGFTWVVKDDAAQSVLAWLRHGFSAGDDVLVVCNFTPVPRHGYRVGVPGRAGRVWREVLNTDSSFYGGSNVGNAGGVVAGDMAVHGQRASVVLTLPPLAVIVMVGGGA